MGYSLFVPEGLSATRERGEGQKRWRRCRWRPWKEKGVFGRSWQALRREAEVAIEDRNECASFPLVARAVGTGSVAGILPSVAAVDLGRLKAQEVTLGVLATLKREICLAGLCGSYGSGWPSKKPVRLLRRRLGSRADSVGPGRRTWRGRAASAPAGCFTYEPPPGVVWMPARGL